MDNADNANNETKKKRSARTTKKQIEIIISFLEENKILLQGKVEPRDISKLKSKWDELGLLLNSSGKGPVKTTDQWKHVVAELQTNVKKRARLLYVEKTGTGGGPKQNKELSEIEERLLSLISKVSIEGAPISEPGIYEANLNANIIFEPNQENELASIQIISNENPSNTYIIDEVSVEQVTVETMRNDEQAKENSKNTKCIRNKKYKKKTNTNSNSSSTNMQTLSNLSDNLKQQTVALNNIAKSLDTLATAINKIADKLGNE